MTKRLLMALILVFMLHTLSTGQNKRCVDSICRNLNTCKNDSVKAVQLLKVSDYYYALQNRSKVDSLARVELHLAEKCRNKGLSIEVLLFNAYNCIYSNSYSTKHSLEQADAYLQQALNTTNLAEMEEKQVLVYLQLAMLNRERSKYDEALKYGSMALSISQTLHDDSLAVISLLELGATHQKKKDMLSAFQYLTQAENLISKSKNQVLESLLNRSIAKLYKALDDAEKAKEYLNRSIDINKETHNAVWLEEDYLELAKLQTNHEDVNEVLKLAKTLADSLKMDKYILVNQKIEFGSLILKGDRTTTLNYLKSHSALDELYKNIAPHYEDYVKGVIYLYIGKPDSAICYFKQVEPILEKEYDISSQKDMSYVIATAYKMNNNTQEAIAHFKKTKELNETTTDIGGVLGCLKALEEIYSKMGDFKQAYMYQKQYYTYNDSLMGSAHKQEEVLKEIELEKKHQEYELDKKELKKRRLHNLEYMGITIVIGIVFFLLLTLGFFKVHPWVIKTLGFFSFIFFFEFVTMLADRQIDTITHEEPWKVWLFKIGLISLLLPFHHWIEEVVIHYLNSRKLISVKKNFRVRHLLNVFTTHKKVNVVKEHSEE